MDGLVELLVKLIFFEQAQQCFRFPVQNTIRVSVWFKDQRPSLPAEVVVGHEPLQLNTETVLKLRVVRNESLMKNFFVDNRLFLGPHYEAIGEATILQIIK
ncbi:hypothetical protein GWR56_13555 [Mucilaginibacter sp. 14171R-50]|uniref:hypothetical protein n=1 Tax=Mucilaginibacter sp. 14171R-50 TaxID=2703789 RepID=UPI00138C7F84|nr:hypothetical protein [Mucilaginibacter sp. 14171R-50]QHS56514.1 hypothetical protein GWR56_13555 [Mucilaginibacter sp. 14171R-50]